MNLINRILAPLSVVLVLLLSSCGKEDLVQPCNNDAPATGNAKGMIIPEETGKSDPEPFNGITRNTDPKDTPVTSGEDGGEGISDDGDDLSDTERNRPKKK